jgi:hypothetical protein
MLKLRTKTEFPIPLKRGVIQGIVRLIIERLEIDINNIRAIGYYYYLDENNSVEKLDDIKSFEQWETILVTEQNLLNPISSQISLEAVLKQRVIEFTMLQLTKESGENYGTTPDDWEEDI